ncbi:GNAT family N-acetyltransferase [Pontibacter oryzae]|uniref:N-acetyltransferase n=1 Tax=Pontibacter oryzae TaxID=2304593 RepID=A0A399SJR6_9BACT|nr:GNAT family protein [Pontibacter oryzae]RIJ42733.1 N-acetyltransferase [Pontibacter oryzae]
MDLDFRTGPELQNKRVLLRAFQPSDLTEMSSIAFEEDIWRFMPTRISNHAELQVWADTVEKGFSAGTRYTFMIIDKATGRLAGSTSYGNISAADKRLEIGWTWLAKEFRGTGLNRHCKFLLLCHAFEKLEMDRVELKTDALNMRSRKAMLKLGAIEEGTLRSHTQMHDGRRRDTIYYSILRDEWAGIKQTIFADLTSFTLPA